MADIIIALIVAGFAVFGYKKGFVGSVVGILSLAASLILAWFLYPIIADLLVTFGVKSGIAEGIQSVIGTNTVATEGIMMPQGIQTAINAGVYDFTYGVAEAIATVTVKVISFLAVLLVSRIIIWIAIKLLRVLSNLPVIGFFNHITGLILGAAQGILVTYILLAIIYVAVPVGSANAISNSIEGSRLAEPMYRGNPIVNIFANETVENQNGE